MFRFLIAWGSATHTHTWLLSSWYRPGSYLTLFPYFGWFPWPYAWQAPERSEQWRSHCISQAEGWSCHTTSGGTCTGCHWVCIEFKMVMLCYHVVNFLAHSIWACIALTFFPRWFSHCPGYQTGEVRSSFILFHCTVEMLHAFRSGLNNLLY